MPKIDVPNAMEKEIMKENGLNPKDFCVTFRDENIVCLRNYKTRDDITIHRGDRTWRGKS